MPLPESRYRAFTIILGSYGGDFSQVQLVHDFADVVDRVVATAAVTSRPHNRQNHAKSKTLSTQASPNKRKWVERLPGGIAGLGRRWEQLEPSSYRTHRALLEASSDYPFTRRRSEGFFSSKINNG